MRLMRPIIRLFTKTFSHRIFPDVGMFFGHLIFAAQTMIKKAILPSEAERSSCVTFPVFEEIRNRSLRRKTHQGMKVIWHEQKQMDMPLVPVLVKTRGLRQGLSCRWFCELSPSAPMTVHGDEKEGAVIYPMWHVMMKNLSIGKLDF